MSKFWNMDINVRKATAADYSALCALFAEIDRLHCDHLPNIFQKPRGVAREYAYYSALIADETVALLVAEVSDTLVGFVHAVFREAPALPIFVPRRYVVVDGIVVKSGFQHQGIGSILMEHVQAWASVNGATAIELNVYEFNDAAITFYERLGFQ
ncbi:MAG: GNAT family N-acetyltransferase, partial [Caldilineaceae bacterium]|nr:GNAT family N-acetyltransferase [Caldilineaceae bacterium]